MTWLDWALLGACLVPYAGVWWAMAGLRQSTDSLRFGRSQR